MEHGESFDVFRDIYYGSNERQNPDDPKLGLNVNKSSLDLYLPCSINPNDLQLASDTHRSSPTTQIKSKADEKSNKRIPFVVFIHGGGWRRGDRNVWTHFISCEDTNILVAALTWYFNLYGNVGECLASFGVACAIVSYPLVNIQLPYLLFEMVSSYFFGATVCSLLFGLSWTILGTLPYLILPKLSVSLVVACGMCFYSNIIILFLTIRSSAYRIGSLEKSCVWFTYICLIFLVYYAHFSNKVISFAIISTVFTQFILFYKRHSLTPVTHSDQVNAITKSIAWSQKFCVKNSYFGDLFLMGHSAGGHLATLVSLNHTFSQINKNKKEGGENSIQGVISLCGVYDLQKLSSNFLKQFYLHPTFGREKAKWHTASPLAHAMVASPGKAPSFLLVNAERDLHLVLDAKNLSEEFSKNGISYRHVLIPGTTHFNIMNLFQKGTKIELVEICLSFITDVTAGTF